MRLTHRNRRDWHPVFLWRPRRFFSGRVLHNGNAVAPADYAGPIVTAWLERAERRSRSPFTWEYRLK